jgi:hypothetical protein
LASYKYNRLENSGEYSIEKIVKVLQKNVTTSFQGNKTKNMKHGLGDNLGFGQGLSYNGFAVQG